MNLGSDDWTALRLQIEWGADEALSPDPIDRLVPAAQPVPDRPPAAPVLLRPQREAWPPASGTSVSGRPGLATPGLATPGLATPGLGAPAVATPAERALAAAGNARTLDELRAALDAFEGCALKQTASHLVFAEGDPDSPVLLIGDQPGREEDRSGHPFAGPEGQMLDQMLASIGLTRDRLMLTPLIPWRPPGGRPANPGELALLLPFLHRLIALLQPARLVILGTQAARALAQAPVRRAAVVDWVDMRIPTQPSPIPALLLPSIPDTRKKPLLRRDVWRGLRLLRRALDAPTGM